MTSPATFLERQDARELIIQGKHPIPRWARLYPRGWNLNDEYIRQFNAQAAHLAANVCSLTQDYKGALLAISYAIGTYLYGEYEQN